MTLTAELYFSFRSPYSYLSIGRYRELTETHNVDIALKPVYPLAVRQPDFFERNHPNWLGYTMRDMFRVAQFHGIPFGPPRPDPADRRARILHLTGKAKKVVEQLDNTVEQLFEDVLQGLDASDQEKLRTLLDRIGANLQRELAGGELVDG